MSSSHLLRTAAIVSTIALALTACGPGGSESASTSSTAPVTTTHATTTLVTATASDVDAPARTQVTTSASPSTSTSTERSTSTTAPTTAPESATEVPEHRRCASEQGADGGDYIVTGLRASDPDGGLVARVNAGSSYAEDGVLPEGAMVDTFIDRVDRPSCLITRDGAIWWQFVAPSMTSGLWVNASFLEVHDSFGPADEADVHTDCVYLPDFPDTCIVVYTSGGVIYGADYDNAQAFELVYACVFQAFGPACELLDATDPVETDHGRALSSIPLATVQADCETGVGVVQKLACAELGRRL